jgi:hypothetical protein
VAAPPAAAAVPVGFTPGTTLEAVELSTSVVLTVVPFKVMFSAALITHGSPTNRARATLFWKGVLGQSFVGSGGEPRRRNELALPSLGTEMLFPWVSTTVANCGPSEAPSEKFGTAIW